VKVWLDAQISPAMAPWMVSKFRIETTALRDLGLRDSNDEEIFFAARAADAVVMTKDVDFVELLLRHGPPPRVLWLTTGNTSNARLRQLLTATWPRITTLLDAGEPLVELQNQP
jgi:predicted nuclease of predicted toxin-antitoxin system